jgi:hypothetical protein
MNTVFELITPEYKKEYASSSTPVSYLASTNLD